MSMKEIATEMQVTVRTVQNWISRGRLRVLRLQRHGAVRIRRSEFVAALEASQEERRTESHDPAMG